MERVLTGRNIAQLLKTTSQLTYFSGLLAGSKSPSVCQQLTTVYRFLKKCPAAIEAGTARYSCQNVQKNPKVCWHLLETLACLCSALAIRMNRNIYTYVEAQAPHLVAQLKGRVQPQVINRHLLHVDIAFRQFPAAVRHPRSPPLPSSLDSTLHSVCLRALTRSRWLGKPCQKSVSR